MKIIYRKILKTFSSVSVWLIQNNKYMSELNRNLRNSGEQNIWKFEFIHSTYLDYYVMVNFYFHLANVTVNQSLITIIYKWIPK
jgi:hypothetical protein